MEWNGLVWVIGRLYCASNDRIATPIYIYTILPPVYPTSHQTYCFLRTPTIEWLMAKCVNYVESIHIVHFHAAAAAAAAVATFPLSGYHLFSLRPPNHLPPPTWPPHCLSANDKIRVLAKVKPMYCLSVPVLLFLLACLPGT